MTPNDARKLDQADPLAFARERFLLPEGIIYLDGNSLGALPVAAPKALSQTAKRQWGDDLIGSWTKHEGIDWPTKIAAGLAPIVGARPNVNGNRTEIVASGPIPGSTPIRVPRTQPAKQ